MTVQVSAAARLAVHERSGGRCELCSRGRVTQVHHRRPRGKGGTWLRSSTSPANLLGLDDSCHDLIESRREWALDHGLLLRPADDAATTPVWLRHLYGDGWWLLADDGLIHYADAPGREAYSPA